MLLRTVRTPQRLSALWRHGLWQQRLLSEGRTAPPLENSFVSDALFAATPLAREIVRHLHSTFNIRFLSHVQKESLPPILEGRDLMCHAPTGTGKTLAYLLPVFHVLMQGYGAAAGAAPRPRPCQAFIFVPNPILAEQVYAVACRLAPISLGVTLVGKESRPRTAPVDATVYIAPVHSGDLQPVYWHYSAVPHVVVLDEVDVLMYQQKEYMDRLLLDPPEGVARQLLMFGATVCEDRVMRYMEEEYGLLAAWEYLDLAEDREFMVPDTIEQRVLVAPAHQHLALLLTLVQKQLADPDSKVMVFTPTSEQAIFLCGLFKVLTPSARVHELHGLLEPEARDGVRREFHSFTNQVLFATDVAARGMDFTGVTCVVQLGYPRTRLQYVHRVGRTGRKGQRGTAVLLLNPTERPFLESVPDLSLKISEVDDGADQHLWAASRRIQEACVELNAMRSSGLEPGKGREYVRHRRHFDAVSVWAAWVKAQTAVLPRLDCNAQGFAKVAAEYGRAMGLRESPKQLAAHAMSLLKKFGAV